MQDLDNQTIQFMFLVLVSAPFLVWSMINRQRGGTPSAYLYLGQRGPALMWLAAYLWVALVVICAVNLLIHFGLLNQDARRSLDSMLGTAIVLPGVAFLFLWLRAKVIAAWRAGMLLSAWVRAWLP